MKTIQYRNNLTTAGDTNRGPSPQIWSLCPVLDQLERPRTGMYFFDDFIANTGLISGGSASVSFGGDHPWGVYQDAGAANPGADPLQEGGVINLGGGSASVGTTLAAGAASSFRVISSATGYALQQPLYFEARVAVGSITTGKRDLFIGLAGNDTASLTGATNKVIGVGPTATGTGDFLGLQQTATTTLCNQSLIGFHFRSVTNPTDVGFVYGNVATAPVYPGASTDLQKLSTNYFGAALVASSVTAAGTSWVAQTGFVKLGFLYDPKAPLQLVTSAKTSLQTQGTMRRKLIRIFVNGIEASTFLSSDDVQTASFPSNFMSPCIAFKQWTITAPGAAYIDWIRVAKVGDI